MPPQRVALLVPSLGGGGAERNMARLASGLAGRGYTVDFVAAIASGPVRSALDPAVTLVDLGSPRVSRAIGRLARYLRATRPAVLISSHEHGNVATMLARAQARTATPVVLTVRSTPSVQARQAGDWRDRWLLPHLARRLYPSATRVVALSQGAATDTEAWLGLTRGGVRVIPNPVISPDLERLARQPLDTVPDGQPLVLAVGRLAPEKDFSTLLDAFGRVALRRPDAMLAILGDGAGRATLEQQVRRLGLVERVRLPGYSANPYAWMARARVFVLSSRYEGLPTVLIEALACGARVVSTDCPSGPREILDGGRLGTLVPVGDAPAMADAIGAALDAPRAPASAEALLRYTESSVLGEWTSLLGELGVPCP